MAVKIERKQPEGVNVRMQQGKPAYSHVVTVTGPGKTIYVAGQLARDLEGNIVGPGDMRAQMEQTFKNLGACLKAAGATWADVVKTNTFVTDFDEFQKLLTGYFRNISFLGQRVHPSSTIWPIGPVKAPNIREVVVQRGESEFEFIQIRISH